MNVISPSGGSVSGAMKSFDPSRKRSLAGANSRPDGEDAGFSAVGFPAPIHK